MSDPASSLPTTAPQLAREHATELALLTVFAGSLRVLAAYLLGEGAPFGPDGTGAEAAVHLGGHLYPAHIELIRIAGSARTLSLVLGTATIPLLWGSTPQHSASPRRKGGEFPCSSSGG